MGVFQSKYRLRSGPWVAWAWVGASTGRAWAWTWTWTWARGGISPSVGVFGDPGRNGTHSSKQHSTEQHNAAQRSMPNLDQHQPRHACGRRVQEEAWGCIATFARSLLSTLLPVRLSIRLFVCAFCPGTPAAPDDMAYPSNSCRCVRMSRQKPNVQSSTQRQTQHCHGPSRSPV